MFELTRFEARRHFRQALAVSGGMFGLVVLVVFIYPSFSKAGEEYQEIIAEMPDALQATFGGGDVPFTTLEGFLVFEVYQMVWTMLVGAYIAYAAATLLAGDYEQGNLDVLLMTPAPRRQLVAAKFFSMIPDIVLVSLGTFGGVIVGTVAINESVDLVWLAMLHLLSIPYLLACAAFGLVVSVLFVETARRAQLLSFASIAVLYVLEALVQETSYDWLSALMFSHYLSPADILIRQDADIVGAGVLLGSAVVLLVATAMLFERTDITA